jgi:hypothetical protein
MRIFNKGDRITQPQYGDGTVTDANERYTVIDFDEHGLRTFSTPLVKLGRSEVAAPVRQPAARRARPRSPAKTASR